MKHFTQVIPIFTMFEIHDGGKLFLSIPYPFRMLAIFHPYAEFKINLFTVSFRKSNAD